MILAIDTALARCSAALFGPGLSRVKSEAMTRGHAERLAPLVDELMAEAGVAFAALERIAVTTGPGSFTGLRVGLAFARALALALDRPSVGVSTLEALALETGESGLRAGAIEAPQGCYLARFEDGRPLEPPTRLDWAEAEAALAGGLWRVRGPAASRLAAAAQAEPADAPDILALAARAAGLPLNIYPPNPLYLRAPDAKPPGQ